MILVAGIPSEPPLASVLDRLSDLRADVVVVNQRQFADLDLAFVVDERGRVDGLLRVGRRHVALREVSAVYVRLMDFRNLPEYRRLPEDDPERSGVPCSWTTICAWVDVSPGRVVNRTGAMASNGSSRTRVS